MALLPFGARGGLLLRIIVLRGAKVALTWR
jgi:hypothetical protein